MFGIGAGNRHINEWLFGLDMDRPLGKMRDYLAVLRAFLQGDTGDGPRGRRPDPPRADALRPAAGAADPDRGRRRRRRR